MLLEGSFAEDAKLKFSLSNGKCAEDAENDLPSGPFAFLSSFAHSLYTPSLQYFDFDFGLNRPPRPPQNDLLLAIHGLLVLRRPPDHDYAPFHCFGVFILCADEFPA